MQKVYFISGLGADERAFEILKLKDVEGKLITWLKPDKDETLKSYIQKLNAQVTDAENSMIIGLSFGGILTIELSRINKFKKIILISSIKSKNEKPVIFRFLKIFKIYKIIPGKALTKYDGFTRFMFGVKKGSFEDKILKEAIEHTDPALVKWAMELLAKWDSTTKFNNLVHIHGTSDRIFPFRYIKKPIKIKKGGHFMIVQKADQIGKIVNNAIHG